MKLSEAVKTLADQLSAAQEQHEDICTIQGVSTTLHTILLGMGGTIYNTHTLEPFIHRLFLNHQLSPGAGFRPT